MLSRNIERGSTMGILRRKCRDCVFCFKKEKCAENMRDCAESRKKILPEFGIVE